MEELVFKRIVQSAQSGIDMSLWNVIGFVVMVFAFSYLLSYFFVGKN